MIITDHQKFWARVNKTDTCWLWVGSLDRAGYGKFTAHPEGRKKGYLAHRWSYEQWHGPIAPGLQIDHLCRTPACVNPAHLEAVSPRTNTLRSRCPAANNARKTHCLNGHELTEDNLVSTARAGHRWCLTCHNERGRQYKARVRARRATVSAS